MTTERSIINILGEAAATGRFISVDFLKSDGTMRSMVCKVDKMALARLDNNLITVFDVRSGGYRSFNINSLLYISADGDFVEAI
jgi:hypothetical protein